MNISRWICFGVAMLIAVATRTQGQGSRAEYERAASLRQRTSNVVFRERINVRWLPGNTNFWYEVKTGADTREFILVDAVQGRRQPAFDHVRLAKALSEAGWRDARADNLQLRDLEWKGGASLEFAGNDRQWRANLANYSVTEEHRTNSPVALLSLENVPTASRRTGEETSLNFINKSAGDVELFWLDTAGARRSYGKLAAGQSREQHTFAGHVWLAANPEGRTIAAFEAAEKPSDAEIGGTRGGGGRGRTRPEQRERAREQSPDGKWRAAVKDHNVILRQIESGAEFALTKDGTEDDSYRERFYWAPDSTKLVVIRVRNGEEHKIAFVESSPKDQLQPKLHELNYFKPGDKLPHPRPVLLDVATKKAVAIDDDLFPNPFTETGSMDIRWRNSSRFTFRYNQRGHQVLRIIAVDVEERSPQSPDATTASAPGNAEGLGNLVPPRGKVSAIVNEESRSFIDYSGKSFLEWLDDTDELVWMSERDGWNHLYLYDAKTGRVKNQITKGQWVVRGVDRVDKATRQIWFRAGGIRPEQDPYHVHYCRINFDGSSLVVLTEGDGTHTVEFSPDRKFLIDNYSRVDMPAVTEVRHAEDGKLVCELERGDASALLKTGWQAPERFVAKGRDGVTDIYGIIVRPTNFERQKKYPVIESIYAGPQGAFVPKAFSAMPRTLELAELGFIVVQIDGMGTSQRSKKFHDVCWKNIGDAGLPDRVLWIKAAAAKYPYLDLARVGIYGTSAGGQNSLGALLTQSDFYRAGVADCGCHDNRMDKIWWNEQWMGWPVGPHYEEQSNVTLAHQLQGKLLLMVGEMDRNVDPASTFQVANALIKANKDFEFLVVPGAGHGVAGSPYGKRRLQDFFVRHLHGKEPRWN